MKRRTVCFGVIFGVGLGLAWALLWFSGGGLQTVQAQGPDAYSVYYVAVGGNCAGAVPCYSSVQAAVDAVDDPGDMIRVAAGTYGSVQGRPAPLDYVYPPASGVITQVVYISKTLSLQGGYTTADWTTPDPALNLTILDAAGQGRVLFITGSVSPTIEGFHLTGGDANALRGAVFGGSDSGGGVYVNGSSVTLRDNVIWGNLAPNWDGSGGGVFLWQSDGLVRDNLIHNNEASYGGGLHAEECDATIEGNQVLDNLATFKGGGVSVFFGTSTVSGNEVALNDAMDGGGLVVSQDASTFTANRVYSNTAALTGGGWDFTISAALLEGNQTYGNIAGNEGGGLYVHDSHPILINNVVADNRAATTGSGVCIVQSSPQLLHTTIARNTGGDGSGIHVKDISGVWSSPSLTNTIISDQLVGVYVSAGNSASLDSTLWYSNGMHWSGAVTRSNDRVGDPAFLDPSAADYHLGPASAAIDGGVDAGVTVDLDGEARPSGTGYDIGADERAGASRYNLDLRVAASSDDAEERGGGWTTVSGDSLTLGDFYGNLQTVGLRFDGLAITPGMQIASAYVQFESDASWSGSAQQTIEGHADDDAPAFANGWNTITSRPRTAAAVSWPVPDWTVVGAQDLEQRTPDLSAVLQEIVDRPGWAPGNAVGLIFSGIAGRRVAESYDGDPPSAPLLHVEFTSAPPSTCWAMVNGSPTIYNQVQAAVDAAVDGDLVKVAGYCGAGGVSECPNQLRSYWKLDEETGPTYDDFVSHNDASCSGMPCPTKYDELGPPSINGAQTFDAVSTVNVAPNALYDWSATDDFSIEFWMRTDPNSNCQGNQVVIGRDAPAAESSLHWWMGCLTGGAATFSLMDTDGVNHWATRPPDDPTGPPIDVTDGQWHHVVGVRYGSQGALRLYVDGQHEAGDPTADDYTGTFGSATTPLNIGWLNFGQGLTFHFQGQIDELAIYGRVLQPAEIEQHYLARRPYCYSPGINLAKTLTLRGGYSRDDWSWDPLAYPTTLDARQEASVLYISGDVSPTLESLRITGGLGDGILADSAGLTLSDTAVISNGGYGVRGMLMQALTLRDSEISDNQGTGVYVHQTVGVLSDNTIARNGGTGVVVDNANVTLEGNTIEASGGRGVWIEYSTATLEHNRVISNAGGGIAVMSSSPTIHANEVLSNTAPYGAGIMCYYPGTLTLEGNTILYNVASERGGALYVEEAALSMTNNVVADNQAADRGSGISLLASTAELRHNTFARNSGGDGSAVWAGGVWPLGDSDVTLENTVIVSHTVGLSVTAGSTAQLEGTLWGSGAWANDADWGGDGTIDVGTVNLWGDPAFLDPDGGDYHIGLGSAALNAGVDVLVFVDIDGEPRPQAWRADIGADEVHPDTPVPQAIADLSATRSGSDLVLDWSPVTQDLLGNPLAVDHYRVYRRANDPYYGPIPPWDAISTPVAPPFVDAGVLGDPANNDVYLVTAVSVDGVESVLSNRVGAFSYALAPAAGPGERAYNLIALPLAMPIVVDADTLAAYVGPGAYMVMRHDAAAQAIEWRLPGLAGTNFALGLGEAPYLYLDETAFGVVSLVGGVPTIGTVSFVLTPGDPGGSCAYNFISVPLHRADLADADALAADIGGVYSVSRYNAATQDLTWRMPGVSGENFPVRVGYPYIVCLDETAPPSWP